MARQRLDWSPGRAVSPTYLLFIGMALGLAQLELVLSASREPVRYQLKFILIGLGALAGYHIYQASQMLLFPLWQAGYRIGRRSCHCDGSRSRFIRLGTDQASRGCCQCVHLSTGSASVRSPLS